MNASANIDSARQSLLDKCKKCHWHMIQQFAEAEIAMAAKIGPGAPATFGAKVNLVLPKASEKERRSLLTDARNVVAHAYVTLVEGDSGWVSLWRVADAKGSLNTLSLNKEELEAWEKSLTNELQALLREVRIPVKS